MRQLLDMTSKAAVHHISKLSLLRHLHAKYRIDKRHLTDLLQLSVVRTTRNVYLQPSGDLIQLAEVIPVTLTGFLLLKAKYGSLQQYQY